MTTIQVRIGIRSPKPGVAEAILRLSALNGKDADLAHNEEG